VLLFPAVGVLGVAWFRVASAALIFAAVTKPWRTIAFVILMPIGFAQAVRAFANYELVPAGIGVGICSSVIPYVCDQLAMSRLPRATFALLLALLPATATIIAALVLAQIPSVKDVFGVALVMVGVAMHKPAMVE
jgi:inner membrane transporter RhtA